MVYRQGIVLYFLMILPCRPITVHSDGVKCHTVTVQLYIRYRDKIVL